MPHRSHRANPDPLGALHVTTTTVALVWLVAELAFSVILAWGHLGGRDFIGVDGGSMEHTIHLGDGIIVDKATPGEQQTLRIGTIATFSENDGHKVTHRVIAVLQPGQEAPVTGMGRAPDGGVSYITQGDANATPDPTLRPASSVYGTVTRRIPFGGYMAVFMSTWLGRALMFVPIAWVAGTWMTHRRTEGRRKKTPAAAHTAEPATAARGISPGGAHRITKMAA